MTDTKQRRTSSEVAARRGAIIDAINAYLTAYTAGKVTLRQMHYVLVEGAKLNQALDYSNTENDYKRLSDMLADARREGKIDPERFEDRTRTHHEAREVYYTANQVGNVRTMPTAFDEKAQVMSLATRIYWASSPNFADDLYQPNVALVMVEKRALEGIFEDAINKDGYFVVCAGYNSYSQLYDLAKVLKQEKRQIHAFLFSDFDPSGKDISRNFIAQLEENGVHFASTRQVALTSAQVAQYSLPMAPTKAKDSRAASWTEVGVVELDALKPNVLHDLIRECIDGLRDNAVGQAVTAMAKVMRRIAKRAATKKLAQLCANYPAFAADVKKQYNI